MVILAIDSQMNLPMPTYTIAQAKDQLSKLVNEALDGSTVRITRHGKQAVRVVPDTDEPRVMTPEDWDRLFKDAESRPLTENVTGADIIRAMRDDEVE